jgi:hypothetical protein
LQTSYQTALEIVAERAISSAELDQSTMENLACEYDSGEYFLGHPAVEDNEGFLFGVLALKTLAASDTDFERAASARLLRASADAIERYEFVPESEFEASGRFVVLHAGDEIRIIIVRYLPGHTSKSLLVGSLRITA